MLILYNFLDRVAHFALFEDVARAPAVFFGVLDGRIHLDGKLLILAHRIVDRPPGKRIQLFGIG